MGSDNSNGVPTGAQPPSAGDVHAIALRGAGGGGVRGAKTGPGLTSETSLAWERVVQSVSGADGVVECVSGAVGCRWLRVGCCRVRDPLGQRVWAGFGYQTDPFSPGVSHPEQSSGDASNPRSKPAPATQSTAHHISPPPPAQKIRECDAAPSMAVGALQRRVNANLHHQTSTDHPPTNAICAPRAVGSEPRSALRARSFRVGTSEAPRVRGNVLSLPPVTPTTASHGANPSPTATREPLLPGLPWVSPAVVPSRKTAKEAHDRDRQRLTSLASPTRKPSTGGVQCRAVPCCGCLYRICLRQKKKSGHGKGGGGRHRTRAEWEGCSVRWHTTQCRRGGSINAGGMALPVAAPAPTPARLRPALPRPAPPRPSLPCPALPCPALPFPALPCPALPCPALPCPSLPCPALPCPALPCPALPCPALRLHRPGPCSVLLSFTRLQSGGPLHTTGISTKWPILPDLRAPPRPAPSAPTHRASPGTAAHHIPLLCYTHPSPKPPRFAFSVTVRALKLTPLCAQYCARVRSPPRPNGPRSQRTRVPCAERRGAEGWLRV